MDQNQKMLLSWCLSDKSTMSVWLNRAKSILARRHYFAQDLNRCVYKESTISVLYTERFLKENAASVADLQKKIDEIEQVLAEKIENRENEMPSSVDEFWFLWVRFWTSFLWSILMALSFYEINIFHVYSKFIIDKILYPIKSITNKKL